MLDRSLSVVRLVAQEIHNLSAFLKVGQDGEYMHNVPVTSVTAKFDSHNKKQLSYHTVISSCV